MTIKEKLQLLSGSAPNEMHLFKEGVFWIAYEQCAYWFHLKKGYKPTKKFVKTVGQEVVSVGFPESVLANMHECAKGRMHEASNGTDGTSGTGGMSETLGTNGDRVRVFLLKEGIDMEKFLEWKGSLESRDGKDSGTKPPPNLPRPLSPSGQEIGKRFLEGGIETSGTGETSETGEMIAEMIRNFDLSNVTPMEGMMFLAELKGIVRRTNNPQ